MSRRTPVCDNVRISLTVVNALFGVVASDLDAMLRREGSHGRERTANIGRSVRLGRCSFGIGQAPSGICDNDRGSAAGQLAASSAIDPVKIALSDALVWAERVSMIAAVSGAKKRVAV